MKTLVDSRLPLFAAALLSFVTIFNAGLHAQCNGGNRQACDNICQNVFTQCENSVTKTYNQCTYNAGIEYQHCLNNCPGGNGGACAQSCLDQDEATLFGCTANYDGGMTGCNQQDAACVNGCSKSCTSSKRPSDTKGGDLLKKL